jgi:hypothetical protein
MKEQFFSIIRLDQYWLGVLDQRNTEELSAGGWNRILNGAGNLC